MKRILVTGGNGFIGNAVLKSLADVAGIELHATYHNNAPVSSGNIKWHKANLLNAEAVEKLFEAVTPTHLIQLAWCSEHGVYWKDPANIEWLTANLHTARSFVKYGGQRAVFAGTSAEYEWPGSKPFNELTTTLAPQSLYGSAKLALYWALSGYFTQEKISWAWARMFNPFGAGEDPRRLIPKTCLRLLNGEAIHFDAGTPVRDFLHVYDVGAALAAVLDSDINGPVNIGSGQPLSIRQVVEQVAVACKRSQLVEFEKVAANTEADWVVADTAKLNNELGWQPEKSFEERIYETCQWWANNYKKQTNIL